MSGHPIRFWWIGVSALLVCLGSFGPWAKVLFISVSGLDGGDGWITLIAGLIALAFFVVYVRSSSRPRPAWPLALVALAGAAAAGTGAYDWSNLEAAISEAQSEDNPFAAGISVGWGLVLVTVSGFSLVAAAVVSFIRRSDEPTVTTPRPMAEASTTQSIGSVPEAPEPSVNTETDPAA